MQIQNIDSVSTKGLYFTRVSNVLFDRNPKINFHNPVDVVKKSEQGFRYIEDRTISDKMKDRFMSVPFIKNLSEKFDTFVFFRELPKEHPDNLTCAHFSMSKILWADLSKDHADLRVVCGNSQISQDTATNKMLENLKNQNFSEIG